MTTSAGARTRMTRQLRCNATGLSMPAAATRAAMPLLMTSQSPDTCGCNKGNTGNTTGSAIHPHPVPADNTANEAPATALVGGNSAHVTSAFEKVGTLTANNHSVSPSLMKVW